MENINKIKELLNKQRLFNKVVLEGNPVYYYDDTREVVSGLKPEYRYSGKLIEVEPQYISKIGLHHIVEVYGIERIFRFSSIGLKWFLTEEDALKAKSKFRR